MSSTYRTRPDYVAAIERAHVAYERLGISNETERAVIDHLAEIGVLTNCFVQGSTSCTGSCPSGQHCIETTTHNCVCSASFRDPEAVNIEGQWHEVRDGKATSLDRVLDQCEGNACGVVAVISNGQGEGYTVVNRSDRNVVVSIRWLVGFQCIGWQDIPLGPGQSARYGNWGYCNPYRANYA